MSGLILPDSMTPGVGLTYIEKDREWRRSYVTGRYDCERDQWANPKHRKEVILSAWLIMAENQAKIDSIWTGDAPKVEGPLQHIDFADSEADLTPEDEARQADRRARLHEELVDFTLTAPFKRRVTNDFTARF